MISYLKPWLWLPPKLAHDLGPIALQFISKFQSEREVEVMPLKWRNLNFRNRMGIAGGVDKDATAIEAWWRLGAGFVEVGTVTPLPQEPNPGTIMSRDISTQAVWNKMGFPSKGMKVVAQNLDRYQRPYRTPIFVNIGKNRTTKNEEAAADYCKCFLDLAPYADAFVINISSPNTLGLRALQSESYLREFLQLIFTTRAASQYPTTPLLLKLSPDLSDAELNSVLQISLDLNIDGWIATNTTTFREANSPFPTEGGVSGGPLSLRSQEFLRRLVRRIGSDKQDRLVISVGGVMSASDVAERLSLGADLVQVYAALIYSGPFFFKQVARTWRVNTSAHDKS